MPQKENLEEKMRLPKGVTIVGLIHDSALTKNQQMRVMREYCNLGYITKATFKMVDEAHKEYWGHGWQKPRETEIKQNMEAILRMDNVPISTRAEALADYVAQGYLTSKVKKILYGHLTKERVEK